MSKSKDHTTVAVDMMGGDFGLPVTIPAVLKVAQNNPNIHFKLVGRIKEFESHLSHLENVSLVQADDIVNMSDSPSAVIRSKKSTSMSMGIDLVKNKSANVFVSAGNTGALMALSHFRLKMQDGISRPAIMNSLPTRSKKLVRVLDLGANVACVGSQLYEFALVAVAAAKAEGIDSPKVGLLNVGHEAYKGHDQIKIADELLRKASGINYSGYVEGDEIFVGDVDIVVCDGFVGNVLLKSCEGIIGSIAGTIKDQCKQSILCKIAALFSKQVFQSSLNYFHPDKYNGALLAGLNGVVVKSHGGANVNAFTAALSRSIKWAEGPKITENIKYLVDLNKD